MLTSLLVGGAAGCDEAGQACTIATDQISMNVKVIDAPMGIVVVTELRDHGGYDSGVPVELCEEEGERILVNGREARPEEYEDVTRYVRMLDGPSMEYEVVYERKDGDARVVVEPPPPFEISGPGMDQMLSRAADVELTWTAGDPNREVLVNVERDDVLCLDGWEMTVADAGSLTIPAGALTLASADAGPNCDASFVITRTKLGEYDASLESSGSIEAVVRRKSRFVSIP